MDMPQKIFTRGAIIIGALVLIAVALAFAPSVAHWVAPALGSLLVVAVFLTVTAGAFLRDSHTQ
jgi:hypothetical protein